MFFKRLKTENDHSAVALATSVVNKIHMIVHIDGYKTPGLLHQVFYKDWLASDRHSASIRHRTNSLRKSSINQYQLDWRQLSEA